MIAQRTKRLLDANNVKYVQLVHSLAYTALDVAASVHLPARHLAKSVVLKLDGELTLAVVPADEIVDFDLLRNVAGARQVELANELELGDRFAECELGAMPAMGNMFGMETYVDEELSHDGFIVFNAGSHTDLIAMSFADYRRLVRPKLVYIAIGMAATREGAAV